MPNPPALDEHLTLFRHVLQDAGFIQTSDRKLEEWAGSITVEWSDSTSGEWFSAGHSVSILLGSGFPYQAPAVICTDTEPPLQPTWHLLPGQQQVLCLWDSQVGWRPHFSGHKLLRRISEWFYHYHTDTWPPDSLVPDLHRYLDSFGIVLLGEDWQPARDAVHGQFALWLPRKSRSVTVAIAASLPGDAERSREPEPRLAERFVFSAAEVERYPGVWFRVSSPFVPPNNLSALLHLIDTTLTQPLGWARQHCINALPKKNTQKGFSLAIGYKDYSDVTRWLLLWAEFPKHLVGGNRFRWAQEENLPQTKLKAFQTAPARNEDLLRRSAFVSKTLAGKTIAIFGIGSLGGSVSLLLAKAGVPTLRLIDDDTLLPGNVMRHILGLFWVGYNKTFAVKQTILGHCPDCSVVTLDTTWNPEALAEYVKGCDLVIDATGNPNFTLFLNQLCIEIHVPLLVAATYRRARIGRLLLRATPTDPCVACYVGSVHYWSAAQYPPIPRGQGEEYIEDGCGVVTEEAVALDVEAMANFTARVAIQFLQRRTLPGNLGILVNEPLLGGPDILAIPGIHWITNPAHPTCAICGNLS